MPYRIYERDSIVEVLVWGMISAPEIIEALRELHHRDSRKQISDLWNMSESSMVPLTAFSEIIEAVHTLCSPDMVGRKSAIVVSSGLQKMAAQLYLSAAKDLPFEIQAFTSRKDAISWLMSDLKAASA
jgi:hypothetical protein